MAKTVVGRMENLDDAQAVVRALVSAGVRREDIGFMASEKLSIPASGALNESEGGEHAAHGYAEDRGRGGILVTVAAGDGASADKAAAIMRRHGAVDIHQHAPDLKKQAASGTYKGPERRVNTTPWLGQERRRAA